MKKKILVGITILAVVAALAAAFTSAQFDGVNTSDNNILTFGDVTATGFCPSPLVDQQNLAPGEYRESLITLTPHGSLNQDVYIGLRNQWGNDDAGFGDQVEVALFVEGVGWLWGGSYKDVHELYTDWQKILANAVPETPVKVTIRLHVKDTLPSTFEGVSYQFKTYIYAVQVGGTPPTAPPWQYPTFP